MNRPTPPSGTRRTCIKANGTVSLASITFLISTARAGTEVFIDWNPDTIIVATTDGELLAKHPWPAPGTTYVSPHQPDPTNSRGGRGRKRTTPSVTNVLTHQLSPMS